jgi:hypothetical protein
MSERITWEACPVCGSIAAVGWGSTESVDGPAHQGPTEFDCPKGCRLSQRELTRAFA